MALFGGRESGSFLTVKNDEPFLTVNNPPCPVLIFLRALGVDAEMEISHV